MKNLQSFRNFLIVEKIESDKITVYHRTKYEKPEDFKLGFKVGGGAYHGAGLYSTQDLKDQMDDSMITTYGPIIVEFDVRNTGKFLYFDLDLARKIMSGNSLEKKRNNLIKNFDIKSDGEVIKNYTDYLKFKKNNPDFQNKELDDELNKLKINKEEYKPYGLISQLKKILGGKFNKIYQCSKDQFDRLENELYNIQTGQRNAGIANEVIRLPGILANIDGMVYTGFVDGNCVLIYDPNLAFPTKWALVPDKETYDKGIQWNSISRNLNKDLEKSHIFTNEKSGILYNQGKIGDKVEIQNPKTSKMVMTNIIGRIPEEDKWKEYKLGITSDLSKKLDSQEDEEVLVIWRGLKNIQDKILNQMNLSPEFISGLNLMDVLKEKGEKYEKLCVIFRQSPDIILSNLKLDLFGKNAESNRTIIKDFVKESFEGVNSYSISNTFLEFLFEKENKDFFDICKSKMLKLNLQTYDIKKIFFDKEDSLYEGFHKYFTDEELNDLLIHNLENVSLFNIIDSGLLNSGLITEEKITDIIFEKEGEPIKSLFNRYKTEEYLKIIFDILIKNKTQESVFDLLKKNNLIYTKSIFELVFTENKQSIFNDKILIEYLKLIRDYLSKKEWSSVEDYITNSNNPIIKKYKKSILKQKYVAFFDSSSLENNYKASDFIEVFYNSSDTLDVIKKWFSTGKIKIKKDSYSYKNYFISRLFDGLEKIANKKDSETFIKNVLDFLFNIKELRLNFLAKDPTELFKLVKENSLVKKYEKLSEDLYDRSKKLRDAKYKREDEIRNKNYEESENRKNEVLEILNSSKILSELARLLDEKRLLLCPKESWVPKLADYWPEHLFTRNLSQTEIDKFNSIIDSFNKELKLYISEGKIQSKYSQAKNVTDIIELYAKELSTIKSSLNTLSYKFKDLLHKVI